MIAWTVLLSVVMHCGSARSLAKRYGSTAAATDEADGEAESDVRPSGRAGWTVGPGGG